MYSDPTSRLQCQLEEAKKTFQREKNLPPEPAILRNRESLISEAIMDRLAFEQSLFSSDVKLLTTHVGSPKCWSQDSIENLSPVKFKDMFVRKVHKGNYALCRVITQPTRNLAIQIYVEDPSGHVHFLCIYNFGPALLPGPKELDALFPIGTILAIREPYLKSSINNSSRAFIRVDSPTDIIFVNNQSKILQGVAWTSDSIIPGGPSFPATASGWKEIGNAEFKAGRYLSAAVAFTKGLSCELGNMIPILRSNRAEAYLKLGYFGAALTDAITVLEANSIDQNIRAKSLLRAGRANYGQDKFQEALQYFTQLIEIYPNNPDGKRWIANTNLRLAEQTQGAYNWVNLFKESQIASSSLDVADYIGPIKVARLPSRGGGRGIVASRDILPGELLLVSKPFVAAFPEEFKSPSETIIMGFNLIIDRIDRSSQVAIIHKCIQKLYGNPALKNLVYDLYHPAPPGSTLSTSYSVTTGPEILHEPLRTGIDIDVTRVENICSMNAFGPIPLRYADFVTDNSLSDTLIDSPTALYLFPSLFNHSCCPNTNHIFFREVMVIRATAKIPTGEEIFLSYTGSPSYKKRADHLSKWGFTCHCQLCKDDRAEKMMDSEKREQILDEIENSTRIGIASGHNRRSTDNEIKGLENMVDQVRKTYSANRRSFKAALAYMHHHLANKLQSCALTNQSHYLRAISEEIKALRALGIPVIDDSTQGRIAGNARRRLPINLDLLSGVADPQMTVMITLMIVGSFLSLQDHIRAERWLRVAWSVENITVGGGRKLFEERYGNIISTFGPEAKTFMDDINE